MKIKLHRLLTAFAALAVLSTIDYQQSTLYAQGTAFTYQGQLQNNGSLANGTYNLQFQLYTNSSGGTAVAGPVATNGVTVSNGLFTVAIDFGGSVWNGATNWLQIGVETNGGSGFTTLSPRQELTPTPYAIYAEAANAAGLSGTIPSVDFSGTYVGAVILNNPANSFAGNGGSLTNVNAAMLGGLASSSFWQIAGNAGTTPGPNFVGTTDNHPLEFHVDGMRALRLEPAVPTNGAPNVIGGSVLNFVSAGTYGGTIGGGGATNWTGSPGTNSVTGNFGVVAGGVGNTAYFLATVAGGDNNTASASATAVLGGAFNGATGNYSTVGGGFQNTASGAGAFIGGGGHDGINYFGNQALGGASVVGGGLDNNATNTYSTVGGGATNVASGFSSTVSGGSGNAASGDYSSVGGGTGNTAGGANTAVSGGNGNGADGDNSFVGGGDNNIGFGAGDMIGGGFNNQSGGGNNSTISGGNNNNSSGSVAFIGGGQGNQVSAFFAAISGGVNNTATNNSTAIGGGTNNIAGGYASTVPGGAQNQALGDYSFAAGNSAVATNNNTFVWSDGSTNTISTATNQFVARASGGFVLFSSAGSTGVSLAHGSGSWSSVSDRNAKEDFAPLNASTALAGVAALPLTTWSYRTEPGVRHAGPMAQDFYATFGIGEDDRHISEVDEGGVALAAIQGLNQKLDAGSQKSEIGLRQAESQIDELKTENAELKARLEKLESLIASMNRGGRE